MISETSRRWKAVNRISDGVHEKRCPTCCKWFPRTIEHFTSHGKQGLHSQCRPCHNAAARARALKNYVPRIRTSKVTQSKQSFDASALEAALRGKA